MKVAVLNNTEVFEKTWKDIKAHVTTAEIWRTRGDLRCSWQFVEHYLDYYPPDVGRIDYRQSIFIFLGHLINNCNAVLNHWKHKKKREDINLREFNN